MAIFSKELSLESKGELDIIDITPLIQRIVEESGLKDGIANIFAIGSTAAITTIEYERGLLKDLPRVLEELIPKGREWEHNKSWEDPNGHSHLRASLIGPSLTVPFRGSRLVLGTWQQIVFLELDIRRRSRRIMVQLLGE